MGNGPVDAMNAAMLKALIRFFPNLKSLELIDFKVRVLDNAKGTGAFAGTRDAARGEQLAEVAHHGADVVDGVEVQVTNALGSIAAMVRLDPGQCRGVVAMAKGVWWRAMPGSVGVNVLVTDSLSDLGGGACFNDTRVEVQAR